jgi:hypothetical protein
MGSDEKRLFIVLEEHMIKRYSYMIDKFNFDGYSVIGFGDIQIGTKPKDLLNRIKHRNLLQKEYKKLSEFIKHKCKERDVKEIFFSNSEGYIAYNFLLRIKKDFPSLRLIGLQHGVFELKKTSKIGIRSFINYVINLSLGIYPIGGGFGQKIVDEYIVYNEVYKDFLVNTYKWPENMVKVDLNFLKCELFDKKINKQKNNTVLFLSQCLAKASMCDIKEEEFLHNKVLEYLSTKYDKVLIKQHPACCGEISFIKKNNIEFVDDLIEGFNSSSYAYSFASTTLLEAEIFDIETFAIDSELISGDKSLYKLFKNTLNFDLLF